MKQKASRLPFIEEILENVRHTYRVRFFWRTEPLTHEEKQEIFKKAENPYDTNGYSKVLLQGLKNGSTQVTKHVCFQGSIILGSVLYVKPRASSYEPDWDIWGHCFSLVSPHKKVHVVYYSNPQPRLSPDVKKSVGPEHINGGLTMQCNAQEIVIYRREEDTRVLIHELLHASCSDPYDAGVTTIEANTEAWAEIIYCAIMAKGVPSLFDTYFQKQLIHAMKQIQSLETFHHVKSPQDYAWRYYNGKREVWRSLGIVLPQISPLRSPIKSLRMTFQDMKE